MKNLNNTVIKVLTEEHGKKVIKWWKAQGIDTKSEGIINEKDGHSCIYYGVIHGHFSNYPLFDVTRANAKIIELPTKETKTEIPTLGTGVLMEVSIYEDFMVKHNRFVIGKTKEGYLAWADAKTEDKIKYQAVAFWQYARPIQSIPEYTMEELQSKLGHEFKIKK